MFWRSLLYVPANNPKFVSGAQGRGADGILLDLEDSVPYNAKQDAREAARDALNALASGPSDILVRINTDAENLDSDLDHIVHPNVRAIMVTKCDSPEKAKAIDAKIGALEDKRGLPLGGIGMIPMIESAAGFFRSFDVASATSRNVGLLLGSEDFATDCGMEPSSETLFIAKQRIVLSARAANIMPLGLMDTVANFSDLAHVEEMARRAARFGFVGATCVHPRNVEVLNAAFTPSDDEIEHAEGLVACLDEAEREGRGAITYRGKMIDAPLRNRARNLLARVETIRSR